MQRTIEVAEVSADIGQFNVLQNVNFTAKENAVTVLLGRNGAGKTTTLRTIMGYWQVKSGDIRIGGQSVSNLAPHQVGQRDVGYVPEDANVFPNLTVEENLRLSLPRKQAGAERIAEVLDTFPDLKAAYKRLAGTLSGGQRQMLAVGSVLVTNPEFILIDEPSKGLSPLFVDKLGDVLLSLTGTVTILLVEQNFYLASHVGQYYVLLDDGRTVGTGKMKNLVSDVALQRKYLGLNVVGKGVNE